MQKTLPQKSHRLPFTPEEGITPYRHLAPNPAWLPSLKKDNRIKIREAREANPKFVVKSREIEEVMGFASLSLLL